MNKKAIAAFGGLAAFGILTASAASLGGLTSKSLGADNTVIAACDTDGIVLTYNNTYSTTTSTYTTTTVVASGVNATCAAKTFQLTLSKADGTSLGGASGTVPALPANTFTMTVSPTTVDAGLVVSAALSITG